MGVKEKQKERNGDRRDREEKKKEMSRKWDRVGGEKGGLVCVVEAKKKKPQ